MPKCPTCGGAVRVVSSGKGPHDVTNSYVPDAVPVEALERSISDSTVPYVVNPTRIDTDQFFDAVIRLIDQARGGGDG